jgi:putative hydrolase of the HAD superfamily
VIEVVVFDLDGVLRHFDRAAEAALEARHGLEPGSLLQAAFGDELGHHLTTGRIDWPEFLDRLAARVGRAAVEEFEQSRAVLDHAAIEILDRLRHSGTTVALLTNGTLRTEMELTEHGIAESFDRIFNTARLGVAKPHPDVFDLVTLELERTPTAIGFVDDREDNVAAAIAHGWHGHHYRDLDGVVAWLTGLGLL